MTIASKETARKCLVTLIVVSLVVGTYWAGRTGAESERELRHQKQMMDLGARHRDAMTELEVAQKATFQEQLSEIKQRSISSTKRVEADARIVSEIYSRYYHWKNAPDEAVAKERFESFRSRIVQLQSPDYCWVEQEKDGRMHLILSSTAAQLGAFRFEMPKELIDSEKIYVHPPSRRQRP